MKSFNNFYLIFFLIVISSLPFIGLYSSKHFILHDTLQKFQIYSLFASSLKEFGTLPLFNPFYDWGISTSLDNIFGIGVAQYISMALSLLFPSIENELVFYVFSLQLNWIIFLFGFYLINKEMKIPNTANILFLFFLCIINLYGFYRQSVWNLDLISPIPLSFWLIYNIFKNYQNFVNNLFAYLIFFICFIFFGRIPYQSIFILYLNLFLFISLFYFFNKPIINKLGSLTTYSLFIRNNIFASVNIYSIFALIALMICFIFTISTIIDIQTNYSIIAPDRSPNGYVTLNTFLTYGGDFVNGITKFLYLIQDNLSGAEEFNLYVGPILLSGFIYYFIFLRKLKCTKKPNLEKSIFILLIFTIVLSIPGKYNILAVASFYILPEFSMFRHLGLLSIIAKYLLAFFGLIALINIRNKKSINNFIKIYFFVLMVYALSQILFWVFGNYDSYFMKTDFFLFPIQLIFLDLFVLCILLLFKIKYHSLHKIIKIENLLIILILFSSIITILVQKQHLPNSTKGLYVFNNSLPLNFKNLRTKPLEDELFIMYDSILKKSKKDTSLSIPYINQSTFLKKTFCRENYRSDIVSKYKYDILNQIKSINDFGCNMPIIWLVEEKEKIKISKSELSSYLSDSFENFDQFIVVKENEEFYKVNIRETNSHMNIKNYSYNETLIEIDLNEDARLFLLENYDTRKRFFIDNKPTNTNKINNAFQGIKIPRGKHIISIKQSKPNQYLSMLFFLMNLVSIPLIFKLISSKTYT